MGCGWQKEELRASVAVRTQAVQALPGGLNEGAGQGGGKWQREALSLFTFLFAFFFFFLICLCRQIHFRLPLHAHLPAVPSLVPPPAPCPPLAACARISPWHSPPEDLPLRHQAVPRISHLPGSAPNDFPRLARPDSAL